MRKNITDGHILNNFSWNKNKKLHGIDAPQVNKSGVKRWHRVKLQHLEMEPRP